MDMSKILKQVICFSLTFFCAIANAEIYQAQANEPLRIKISKSGLNRISNPPYKITQVTGDDSKFRLKYDEDGTNIYFMPLEPLGGNIEISIRNNAGVTQDLDLQVSDIKGKSIIIDAQSNKQEEHTQKNDIALMLRAMKDNSKGKFYVQKIERKLGNIGVLEARQTKVYKYKDLVGGVFEITNRAKSSVTLDVSIFAGSFDNVKSSYPGMQVIEPKKTATLLIVQKLAKE